MIGTSVAFIINKSNNKNCKNIAIKQKIDCKKKK